MRESLLRGLQGAGITPTSQGRRRLLVGFVVIALAAIVQSLPGIARGGDAMVLALRFGMWLVELALVVCTVSITYGFHVHRRFGSWRTVLTTVVVAGVVGSLSVLAMAKLQRTFNLRLPGEPNFSWTHIALFGLFIGMLHCGVWALAFVYPYAVDDARLRALEADKLRLEAEKLKTVAELSQLRSQLEPHFLLNTLNAIAGLVTEDPREARRLLACLGDLLRDSLRDLDELQTLDDEIAWLRRYAQILESRHSGVLQFRWEIDPEVARITLPRLLLQPLVENAVKHGALRRRTGGVVTVRASADGTGEERRVVCVIEDNGPGMSSEKPREGAFGLRSVRRRLELRYPRATLKIESTDEGTRSIVDLPGMGSTLAPNREVA